MILIIGGFAQGKLHYVKQSYVRCEDGREVTVLDGTLALPAETGEYWNSWQRRQMRW